MSYLRRGNALYTYQVKYQLRVCMSWCAVRISSSRLQARAAISLNLQCCRLSCLDFPVLYMFLHYLSLIVIAIAV